MQPDPHFDAEKLDFQKWWTNFWDTNLANMQSFTLKSIPPIIWDGMVQDFFHEQ